MRHWLKFTGYKSNTGKKRYFFAQHNTLVGCGAPPPAGHLGCSKFTGASKSGRIFLTLFFPCNKLLLTAVLDHRGTQRTLGEDGCRMGSPPCPAFRLSGSGAAQPLAGRWRCSITSGRWGTPASPRSIRCPGALAWAEQEWGEHLRCSTSLCLSSIFDTRISSLRAPL